MTKDQSLLFSEEELVPWKAEWQGMPEYYVEDLSPRYQLIVNFICEGDLEDFGKLLGKKIKANGQARQLQSVWYPDQEIGRYANKRYIQL